MCMRTTDGASGGGGRACLSKVEAARRATQVGRVDYALDLTIPAKSPTYRGEVTVDFELVGTADGLFLDFQGAKILDASINGAPAALAIEGRRVALPAAALAKGRNVVRIAYENAFDQDGSGLHKTTDPADGLEYVFTDCEPFNANRFLPSFDQPDLKATYAITVTAPADWVVVSNAAETSADASDAVPGGRRHRFARTPRFSTYVLAMCAGPYQVWTDEKARIPSRILARRSMAPYVDHAEIFELTRQGFDFFEPFFDIAYPYGKYDQVFVPDYNAGAMENVACVVHSDRLLFRHAATEREKRNRAITVLHEMAHMWFGDLVTMQWWDDLWLNESFATYMSMLALVRATRFKDGFESFRQDDKPWAYRQDELPTTHPIATDVPDTVNAFTNFDGITYAKGASSLKQLSFYVGEDAFRTGVSTYLKAHAHGNARCADFLAAIGKAAGKDLGPWANAWLKTSGVNGIQPTVSIANGAIREVVLTQTEGNGDRLLRPHRLKVAAYAKGKDGMPVLAKVADVTLDGATARVDGLAGVKDPVFLVVNHDDHAYAKAYLDEASLRYATENLEKLPGSFLRTEVWSTVWMMVRDQRARPTAFTDLFLAKAALETNDNLLAAIVTNLRTVLAVYLPDRERAAATAKLQELAQRQVRAVPAGSDLQKVWYTVLVATSESREAQDRLAGLLDGSLVIPGVVLDPEKRWGLVTRLSAYGHEKAPAALAAQRAADPSERGECAAFRAEVSRPEPEAKAKAWARFAGDRTARLDLLREGMGAFHWHHQRELLRPYAERYFEDVATSTSERDLHFGQAYVNALFPTLVVEPSTVTAAKSLLERRKDLPAHVRRALIERTAEVERALAVRATLA